MSLSMEELPAIPSILLQAFPLEAYLRSLSNKLSDNINALHRTVVGLQEEVKWCTTTITNLRQFMRQRTLLELEEKVAEGSMTMPEGFSLESLLPAFLRDDPTLVGGEAGAFAGQGPGQDPGQSETEVRDMRKFMEKMHMERIERNRRKEDWERKARRQNEESRKRLEQMCEELQVSQKRYMDELERIAVWLIPSPAEEVEDEALRSGSVPHRQSQSGRDSSELQEILRGAPLLVEFRRVLIRDMMDRLGEARDEQSMTLGNSIVSLREEMRKEMGRRGSTVAAGGVGADGGGGGGGGGGEVERRLKIFDKNYMQRGEVVATLQDKADRAAVAQKADKVFVGELEKRLLGRIADLEERLTIYEAERAEFRSILRSVVDFHRRGEEARHRGNSHRGRGGGRGGGSGAHHTTGVLPNFVVVDEAVEPRQARGLQSLVASEPRAPGHAPASRRTHRPDS
ncbi:uncharacterized protein Tco025E_09880, partial [Trypanosoma conorhini]